ncbi:MAG: YfhO family protein [Planctomycetota bacterium]
MKKARKDLAALFVIVLLGALCALPFISGEKVLYSKHPSSIDPWGLDAPDWVREEPKNDIVSDKHAIIHPDQVHTRRELDAGHVPLWNPHNFAGLPHQANPLTAVFYPFNLMMLRVNLLKSYGILAALHIFLAALFAYFYLRSIRVLPAAALFGGFAFALGGWMTVHHQHNYFVHAYVWLPLALGAIEHFLKSRGRWALILLSVSVACMFFAGFPQAAFNNALVIAIYTTVALAHCAMRQGVERALGRAGLLIGFGVIGILLAMVQLAPMFDLAAVSGHQDRTLSDLKADALQPIALVALVIPDFFGNPADFHRPNIFESWLLSNPGEFIATRNNYSERSFFGGLLTLLLFLIAPFVRRDRITLTLWITAAAALLVALGTPLLDLLVRLPGFNVGSPMRFTQIVAFAMPMLAAIVLDRMLRRAHNEFPRAFRLAVIAFVIFLAPVILALTAMWVAPTWCLPMMTDLFLDLGAAEAFGVQNNSRADLEAFTQVPLEQLRLNLTVFFLTMLGVVATTLAFLHKRCGPRWVFAIAIVFVSLELAWYGVRFNRPVRSEGFFTTPAPGIDYLRENLGNSRFIRLEPAATAVYFSPNIAQIYPLNDTQGFRALAPQSYLDFMRTVEANPYEVGLPNLGNPDSLLRPQLDLLRVKFAIARREIPGVTWPKVYPPADHQGIVDMVIYENPDPPFPPAYLVHEVEVAPRDRMLETFRNFAVLQAEDENPFAKRVYLNELRRGMQSRYDQPKGLETTTVRSSRAGQMVLEVNAESGGVMVVSQQYMRGWKAWTLNKKGRRKETIPILRANNFAMAVPVEAGITRIELRYDPDSLRWGGLVSGLSLAFLFLVPLLGIFAPRDETLVPVQFDGSPDYHPNSPEER